MIWIILQLIFPAVLLIMPIALYDSKHSCMEKYRRTMLRRETMRKLHTQVLLIILLVFHYVYLNGHGAYLGILVTTVLCIFLFSHNRTNKMLLAIRDNRQIFYFVGLFALATLFMPELYTLTVSIGFILMASAFYPSSSELAECVVQKECIETGQNDSVTTDSNNDNHHANCHDEVDSDNDTESTQL